MSVQCPYCKTRRSSQSGFRKIRRTGRFWRKSDGQWVIRFWCMLCKKGFSSATHHPCYRQNKRHKNQLVRKLLSGGMSQREVARVLRLNRKTVVRKLLYWAQIGKETLHQAQFKYPRCIEVEFDDLETFEHTKCKPLSVTLMVEYKSRRILDFQVSKMPAKGKLAAIARKKYGPRPDERPRGRKILFERLKPMLHPTAIIRSDSNPHYVQDVKCYFPSCIHEQILGVRGAVTGQGELKKTKYDPLFSLNHSYAMLRANINRLIRKTWCTTKRPDRLAAHIYMYTLTHNQRAMAG
jgi:transposase-like protein